MDASKIHKRERIVTNEDDPCLKEGLMSKQCIKDHYLNKSECEIYFENYRNCRKFWSKVCRDRAKKNLSPVLPPHADRDKIREEYQKAEK